MTRSSTMNPHQTRPSDGKTTGTANAGNVQLSFNPIHPSMELPPEQLIRLLGLETKKAPKTSPPQEDQPHEPPKNSECPEPQHLAQEEALSNPNTGRDYRSHRSAPAFRRSPVTTAAIILGSMAAIAIIVNSFLDSSSTSGEQQISPGIKQQQPAGAAADPTSHQQTPAPPTPTKLNTKVTTPPGTKAVDHGTIQRQGAIEAELLRLRNEAEQRFDQRALETAIQHDPYQQDTNLTFSPPVAENNVSDSTALENYKSEPVAEDGITDAAASADHEFEAIDITVETPQEASPAAPPRGLAPDME